MAHIRKAATPTAGKPKGKPSTANVEIYHHQSCPFCHAAFQLLKTKHPIKMVAYDVGESKSKRQEMTQRAKGRTTVPEIFINGQLIGGYDQLSALERAGKLNRLLGLSSPTKAGQSKPRTRALGHR